MRCRFVVAVKALNPAYSESDFYAAKDAGKKYEIPQFIEMSPGFEVEYHDAWVHCCPGDLNSAPKAEPVDDECRAAVHEWMTIHRPAGIAQTKAQLEQIDSIKNPQDRERLLAMGKAYGLIGSEAKKKAKQEATPATET